MKMENLEIATTKINKIKKIERILSSHNYNLENEKYERNCDDSWSKKVLDVSVETINSAFNELPNEIKIKYMNIIMKELEIQKEILEDEVKTL